MRCSSSKIVFTGFFALASFAQVDKSQQIVASKAVAKPEIGARAGSVLRAASVHSLFYNGLQAEYAISSSPAGYAAKSA
jgi:hypothetical protein